MDATAKSNDAGFRMELEKGEVWKFEAAALCGNSRKLTISGLSRAAEKKVGSFGNCIKMVRRRGFSHKLYFVRKCWKKGGLIQ